MKKKLKKTGSDGLMIYFTKEDQELYELEEGDLMDLSDFIIIKKRRNRQRKIKRVRRKNGGSR